MENTEDIPKELTETQLYSLKVKIAVAVLIVLSLSISRYGFWFLGEEPQYTFMSWYMILPEALVFMLFPLLYLGIAYLTAYLRKRPTPRVLWWTIAIWAFIMFLSYTGQHHH